MPPIVRFYFCSGSTLTNFHFIGGCALVRRGLPSCGLWCPAPAHGADLAQFTAGPQGLAQDLVGTDPCGSPGLGWQERSHHLHLLRPGPHLQRLIVFRQACWQGLSPLPCTINLWSKGGQDGEKYLLQIHLESNFLNYGPLGTEDGREGFLKSMCHISSPVPFPHESRISLYGKHPPTRTSRGVSLGLGVGIKTITLRYTTPFTNY